jgi:Dolichyl-phosphate-mannose-protein mannosyltransferase
MRREMPLLVMFLATAFGLRLLSLVYSVYNYDESLYILMGSELGKGHLPYTTICDLKPFGLFGLFALFTSLPLDGILSSRIAANVVVGLTAYLLCRIAALLFEDEARIIGTASGLSYIVFTLATGGVAAQAEIFHNACAVLALLLLLHTTTIARGPTLRSFALVGLVLGVGVQIKQSVAFDMLAFLIGYFILTTPRLADLPKRVRASIPALAVAGTTSAVPTLAVMATYWIAGEWDAWVAGNITAHRVFYGLERPFEFEPAFRAAWEQAPLWVTAPLTLGFAARLTHDGREIRACVFLGVWFASILLGQIFLRIAADHYFLQFLPSASLLAGLALGRGILVHVHGSYTRSVILTVLAGLMVFAIAKQPLLHSFYILRERLVSGDLWAGDTPRRIAADLQPDLGPTDTIYVVGFQPILYYLTQAEPATRFAFTGLPHRDYPGRDGCPWVEPRAEMQRIMDLRPKVIVVEDGVFFRELDPEIKSLLTRRLAEDYRLRKRYEQHDLHQLYPFERFVMNGGAAAEVYERVGSAPAQSAGSKSHVLP